MPTPFDLYQAKQFEGLDPNKFNKDAYMEQQRALFADTFKDQLSKLGGTYQQQTAASQKAQQDLAKYTNTLNELNNQTKNYESNFKSAESNYKSLNSKYDAENKKLAANQSTMNQLNNSVNNWAKERTGFANKANARASKLKSELLNRYRGFREPQKSQIVNQQLQKQLANDKEYKSAISMYNARGLDYNKAVQKASAYKSTLQQQQNVVNNLRPQVAKAEQSFQVANNALKQHQSQVQQTSGQVNNLNKSLGGANQAAAEASKNAEAIQSKIQNYQARSEPLKQLEGKVEGDYAASSKASIDELKKISANNLDPVSQKNAQNLLNQRAEQLAKTYGKNVEDVKKELGTGLGEVKTPQFASQDEFNKFMGIEAPKVAELQEEGALNNLDAQGKPTDTTQNPSAVPPPVATEQQAPAPAPAPAQQAPVAPVQQPTKDTGTSTPQPAQPPVRTPMPAPAPQGQPAPATFQQSARPQPVQQPAPQQPAFDLNQRRPLPAHQQNFTPFNASKALAPQAQPQQQQPAPQQQPQPQQDNNFPKLQQFASGNKQENM